MFPVRIRCAAVGALLLALTGCGNVQDILDQLSGRPAAADSKEKVQQPAINVPSGPQLYCISNIGHTLVVFDLTTRAVLTDTRLYLDLDPVGPWFQGGYGYYLSRVETSGAGSNALIEFVPKTGSERRRIQFPANSNPTTMLMLPSHPGIAWVALRGSTFDNFATNAIAVVDLSGWTYATIALDDLSGPPGMTSLAALIWDPACPSGGGGPCAYALVNNFDGTLRDGYVLALGPDSDGRPMLLEAAAVGRNPQEDILLDSANGRLWVVNNGGYPPNHQPGSVQALNTNDWTTAADVADGTTGGSTTVLAGIHNLDGVTGWVTTYPADAVYTLPQSGPFTLNTTPGLPALTGPLIHTAAPVAGLFAGKGGFGPAHLAELDPGTGVLLADHNLQSGNGPLTCAETNVP